LGWTSIYRVFICNVFAQLTACLRDLAHHFKPEPTETVALCFGIPENTVSSNRYWYCVINWLDEEDIRGVVFLADFSCIPLPTNSRGIVKVLTFALLWSLHWHYPISRVQIIVGVIIIRLCYATTACAAKNNLRFTYACTFKN
jgi:hypothetical protein